mmetsp:Transcript_6673/g.12207  ORF Transcript_6673/g.12207 Transcript_6673/m.12207 type:complete len:269 (+) Transcript_6673:1010-1816(+)
MQTREWDKIDSELAQVRVQLTWETQAASDTGHSGGHKMVEVTVSWVSELQGTEADIVQGLVIDDHDLIGVLNELMHGEGGIVRLDDGIRHLWRWEHGESGHHTVWVLLTDLGDQESSHTGTSTTTERVGDLETLEAVTAFSFLADDIKDRVDEFSTFGVVTLGPVVTSTGLTEYKVIWTEDTTIGTSTDGVHGTWFKINKNSTWDVTTTGSLVVVHVDTLELKISLSDVCTSRVNTVLVAGNFPELGTNLVTTLTGLNMNDFTHVELV